MSAFGGKADIVEYPYSRQKFLNLVDDARTQFMGEALTAARMVWAPTLAADARVCVRGRLGAAAKALGFSQGFPGWGPVASRSRVPLDVRTIQRVENGAPSSSDTRRAIAGAFKFDDLDVFNKPVRLPNIEKWKAFWAELDKTTVIVPITRIQDARTLRTMSEAAPSNPFCGGQLHSKISGFAIYFC